VIVFDLDHFKLVNDTYGHAVGDRVLRIFVDTARGVLRPNDFFGRHGGEEFAVVLPGASIEIAHAIADRVRHAVAEACRKVDGPPLYATVSAGVAAASLSESFSTALEAADRALYLAKSRGRNRVERADSDRPDEVSTVIRVA
jgi:diguanylate cyclase (GGDEF)-like protein